MSTMNISLPDEMKNWVEDEVQQGGFASASEFFRQLVRDAKARKENLDRQARLETLLIAGVESGEPEKVDPQWWSSLRSEMEAELSRRNQGS